VSTSAPKASEAVVCMTCRRIIAIVAVFCQYMAVGVSAIDAGQSEEDD
jgi:hypothetical protein